jgi:hypothetical protein
MKNFWFQVLLLALMITSCREPDNLKHPLFADFTNRSGINFNNSLQFTEEFNPYTYRNFYNGAGVAVGDINNDGLADIYFAGNQVDNKLFLNKGGFLFEDVTEIAGVSCSGSWATGVTFVDINADGFLDIYVCKSGSPDAPVRHNELFINNGNLTFTEKSKEYGLDVVGLSVQAAFFDYDRDGDLDCYLLTNSIKPVGNYDLIKDRRKIPDGQGGGNKFFVNEEGRFKDRTSEVGIYNSDIGFGLGITLGDFNADDWTDIYISNDFFERDYLYLNNKKGGFVESLPDFFESISMGSMGADFADLNNDGFGELFVTEMLPDSLSRRKTKTVFESWDKFFLNVHSGYHYQLPRNVLQRRLDNGKYVEIGRYAGVAATEWSWGALIFDMDNDGLRDIYVANGISKDLLDRDYLTYVGNDDNIRKIMASDQDVIHTLISRMPAGAVSNYAFNNQGFLKFENKSTEWGLGALMFSSGSAYGDFDNDGDLDLVINNINEPSRIFRNNTDRGNYLTVVPQMDGLNRSAIGAEVRVYSENKAFVGDNFMARGFQSSVQPIVFIGLGNVATIDSLLVRWPDMSRTVLYNVPVNQRLEVTKNSDKNLQGEEGIISGISTIFSGNVFLRAESNNLFRHKGNGMNDFNRDRLLPMMYSNEMPFIARGDINGDGIDEMYIGGGKDQSGGFIHYKEGKFEFKAVQDADKYKTFEETKSVLFDVDGDGDLDLYLTSGGRFYSKSSSNYMDKLLLNQGNGNFYDSPHPLPFSENISTSVVVPIDFDQDEDLDLVIGARSHPFTYGIGGGALLFENDGQGKFSDVTKSYAESFYSLGMLTDALATDFDNDGWMDLVLVGDWEPIRLLRNTKGSFIEVTDKYNLNSTQGWWQCITSADLNGDGRPDFVAGNHGYNSFFKEADKMYVHDFDGNGAVEQIFCTKVNGKYYPVADKDDLTAQMPGLKKKLLYYKDYAQMSMDDLFSRSLLDRANYYEVNMLASVMLLSNELGYEVVKLPAEAQYSPIYSLKVADIDGDGIMDLLAGGNQYFVKPQFGRYDASQGWFFKGRLDRGKFHLDDGFSLGVEGQIRDIEVYTSKEGTYILFSKYDDELEIYKVNR